MVDDHHALAKFFDIGEVMRGLDDCGAALAIDFLDELANALFGNHVQADGGRVEEEQIGVVEQGCAKVSSHALAKG